MAPEENLGRSRRPHIHHRTPQLEGVMGSSSHMALEMREGIAPTTLKT